MRRFVRFVLPSLTVAVSGIVAASQPVAAALPVPGIEIEAKSPYCPNGDEQGGDHRQTRANHEGGSTCQGRDPATLTAADINYALMNVQSLSPRPAGGNGDRSENGGSNGGFIGKPDFVNLVCAQGLEAARLTVFPGQPGATARGFARVGKNPTEANTHALGQVAVWATDGTTTGVVYGTQITNNTPDTLRSGGFFIRLQGPITNEATGQVRQGEMSCFTGNRSLVGVGDPNVASPYFESILNTDNDPDAS